MLLSSKRFSYEDASTNLLAIYNQMTEAIGIAGRDNHLSEEVLREILKHLDSVVQRSGNLLALAGLPMTEATVTIDDPRRPNMATVRVLLDELNEYSNAASSEAAYHEEAIQITQTGTETIVGSLNNFFFKARILRLWLLRELNDYHPKRRLPRRLRLARSQRRN